VSASAPLELGSFSGDLSVNPMDRHTLFGFLGFIFLQEKKYKHLCLLQIVLMCALKNDKMVKNV
jgi:hypothetical protein